MIERTIVLPIRDNDGHSLLRQVGAIKSELCAIAGGFSEVKQRGAWKGDDGVTYYDDSLRITTTVEPAQDKQIADRLPEWCEQLRQICLYTHTSEVQADFVYPRVPATATA